MSSFYFKQGKNYVEWNEKKSEEMSKMSEVDNISEMSKNQEIWGTLGTVNRPMILTFLFAR